jgi:hypothetical protein
VFLIGRDPVLVDVSTVHAVQMTFVQIVGVALVRDRLVAAARLMLVLVLAVLFATHLVPPDLRLEDCANPKLLGPTHKGCASAVRTPDLDDGSTSGALTLSTNCLSPLRFSPSERGAFFDP